MSSIGSQLISSNTVTIERSYGLKFKCFITRSVADKSVQRTIMIKLNNLITFSHVACWEQMCP